MDQYEIKEFFEQLGLYQVEDVLRYIKTKEEEYEELENEWESSYIDEEDRTLSFSEKKAWKKQKKEFVKKGVELVKTIETCKEYLHDLTKFSPKLLLEYLALLIKEKEERPFDTYFDVETSEYESMDQLLRMYMTTFITKEPSSFFRKYCNDDWTTYHVLVPSVCEDDMGSSAQSYLCFPKGKKVSVLDSEGNLSSKLKAFPYLEDEMKQLVNFRMMHYELSQKEVLQQQIDKKQSSAGGKVYQKEFY